MKEWTALIPGLLFYVIGIPAGLTALLWWRRDDLHAAEPRRAQELMWFVYGGAFHSHHSLRAPYYDNSSDVSVHRQQKARTHFPLGQALS